MSPANHNIEDAGDGAYGLERKEKEKTPGSVFTFETNPNNLNANLLNSVKDTLELFYEEKVKGIIIRA